MNRIRIPRLGSDSGTSGFTLVEVMVALVVLVIGVLGLFTMQISTIKGNSSSIAISKSVQEGAAVLDMIEALDFTKGALDAGTNKTMTDLYGSAQHFTGTLTYDVVDQTAAQLKILYGLKEDFPAAATKLVTVKALQRVSGVDKKIELQFVKIK
jgi:type IV pilus modification protein PilV